MKITNQDLEKIHLGDSYLTFLHHKILKSFDKGVMICVILIDLH